MTALSAPQAPITGSPSLAADTSRLQTKENLDKAAAQFEALFINQMLRSARAAKLGDGLFDSEALNQFYDMQDAKLSETMAVHTPIGIGKAVRDFLAKAEPGLSSDKAK